MRIDVLEGSAGGRIGWPPVEAAKAAKAAAGRELDRQREPTSEQRFVHDLTADLAGEPSGLSFVYRALHAVVERYQLEELVAVVDGPPADRQVFRAGRLPLPQRAHDRVRELACFAPPGLHAEPAVLEPLLNASITNLIGLALRLDILRHDASHDALTGLLNRRSYEVMLQQAVSQSLRYGWRFALMLLDLNSFKSVNDRLGHAAGDGTLRVVGMELRHSLRAGDVAARIGGDEFALILANGGPDLLKPLMERLEQSVNEIVPGAQVSFSAGLATFPDEADDVESLSHLADQRLYAAKPIR